LAERITHGHYANASVSDADFLWYPPGLPLLLAPLTGLPLELIRLVGPVCLFAAVLCFHRLLTMAVPGRWALGGAYLFGLYPPFMVVLRNTYSEPLAVLAVTAAMLLTARAVEQRSVKHAAWAGLALGVLALTRAAYGWILIACLVVVATWWLARRRRPALMAIVALTVALASTLPWLAYTYDKSGRVLYWSGSGGLSLYWMASPYPGETGEWRPYNEAPPAHRPFFDRLVRMDGPVERDLALQRRALDWVRHRPSGYLGNVPPNLSRLVVGVPDRDGIGLKGLVFAVPNVLLLAALAWVALSRTRLPRYAPLFLAFAAVTFGFHVLLSAEPRMLLPIVPVAGWCVAVGFRGSWPLSAALSRRPDRRASGPGRPARRLAGGR
jgi:4-amino-4-deoxy-L-arabinose transferase-like glycosyltransferase